MKYITQRQNDTSHAVVLLIFQATRGGKVLRAPALAIRRLCLNLMTPVWSYNHAVLLSYLWSIYSCPAFWVHCDACIFYEVNFFLEMENSGWMVRYFRHLCLPQMPKGITLSKYACISYMYTWLLTRSVAWTSLTALELPYTTSH